MVRSGFGGSGSRTGSKRASGKVFARFLGQHLLQSRPIEHHPWQRCSPPISTRRAITNRSSRSEGASQSGDIAHEPDRRGFIRQRFGVRTAEPDFTVADRVRHCPIQVGDLRLDYLGFLLGPFPHIRSVDRLLLIRFVAINLFRLVIVGVVLIGVWLGRVIRGIHRLHLLSGVRSRKYQSRIDLLAGRIAIRDAANQPGRSQAAAKIDQQPAALLGNIVQRGLDFPIFENADQSLRQHLRRFPAQLGVGLKMQQHPVGQLGADQRRGLEDFAGFQGRAVIADQHGRGENRAVMVVGPAVFPAQHRAPPGYRAATSRG